MNERNLELEDLLSGMRGEGKVVSQSGDFTLHISKAKEKLKEHQLSNPHFYILKLVQSAVLSGAGRIDVQCQSTGVTLEHDGQPPSPDELQDLLSHIFLKQEEADPGLRALNRLAAAVNTAVSASARELVIECSRESELYRQRWTASGSTFEAPVQSDRKTGLRFKLTRRAEDVASSLRYVGNTRILDLVQGHRSSIQKEEAALWDRCIFAPLAVVVNEERVDRTEFGVPPFPGGKSGTKGRVPWLQWRRNRGHYLGRYCDKRHHLIQAFYPSESPKGSLVAPQTSHSFLVSQKYPHRPGHSCSLILGLESDGSLPNRINYIQEGVLIQQEVLELGFGGVVALVNTDHLGTDLSGFNLTENARFAELKSFLSKAIRDLAQEYQARLDETPFRIALVPQT